MWTTLLMAILACGPDPEMVAENERLTEEVTGLSQKLERAERERDALKQRIERMSAEQEAREQTLVFQRLKMQPGDKLRAILQTSKGDFRCELFPGKAPKTVLNFVELAEGSREWTDPRTGRKTSDRLYDGTIFHRVIPGFMIQGGDPLGRGSGGPGYTFEDETDNGLTFDAPGLLAMANRGPDTNGSQFFITEGTPSHLNGKHTIFGACEPTDLVKTITGVQRDRRDKPLEDVVLKRVVIKRGDG